MQINEKKLISSQIEIHHAAHSQDLVEAPKRAMLDRAAEGMQLNLPKVEQADKAAKSGDSGVTI